MQTGIKSISLEGFTEILVVFGVGLVPRAVGLGRLMLASVVGVVPDFGCPDCTGSVIFTGATMACIGLNLDCLSSTSEGLMRGGSLILTCGPPINAQGPGSTLGPQGSVLSCFCCKRSINLQQAAYGLL